MTYALILLAVVCRLIPHPPNFTPVMAVSLFGGAMLPRRIAWAAPLVAMVSSDLALGYPFGWMNGVVYACFLAAVALGRWLQRRRTWTRTAAAALGGSLLFYVVTNFAVWLGSSTMYAHTPAGLASCYVAALPFFRNALAGDLFWTAALFVQHDLARAWVASRRIRWQNAGS
jgi:uncharacterized protein DUF6580